MDRNTGLFPYTRAGFFSLLWTHFRWPLVAMTPSSHFSTNESPRMEKFRGTFVYTGKGKIQSESEKRLQASIFLTRKSSRLSPSIHTYMYTYTC